MTIIQKTIGRLPVNLGDYDSTRAYGKKNRVTLYDCEWESKVDNNTYPPATLVNGVVTPDTTHWRLNSGVPGNYGLDAEIGTDNQPGTIKGRIKSLEDSVGTGGTVDQKIASAVQTEATRATGAETALGNRVTSLENEVGSGGGSNTLSSRVTALESGKADKANTIAGYGIDNAYTKTEVNGLVDTPHQNYVTISATSQTTDATDVLPASDQAADTIYRVANWDGSANSGAGAFDVTKYSEYAWDDVSSPNKYVFLCVKSQIGEVFDISVYNNNAKYADLAAALNGGANIPDTLRKGGMSVKFVQSSDNKYTQYRLMSQSFSTYASDWECVDLTFMVAGKNKLNKDTVLIGKFVDPDSGREVVEASAWCSDYIPVLPNTEYTCNYFIYWCCFDSNKQYISDLGYGVHSDITPSNAAYIRISDFIQSRIDTTQIEIGSKNTTYEPYRKVIDKANLPLNSLQKNTFIVDPDGVFGYSKISDAVNSCVNGDTVIVLPGLYEDEVNTTDKAVNIIGLDKESTVLFNTNGDHEHPPLFQSKGSLRNMTVYAKQDPNITYEDEGPYAIHIDTYGTNGKYLIDNCHLMSDFNNTLGCGATPNHELIIQNCIVECTTHSAMAYHLGGNAKVALINNIFKSLTSGVNDLEFQWTDDNPDVINVLAINNAIKTVHINTTNYVLDSYSYGNLANSLNYSEV